MPGDADEALRAQITPRGAVTDAVDALRQGALELGLRGWVRGDGPPSAPVTVHAEGPAGALATFAERAGTLAAVDARPVRVEGHEQFAVRGVSAGAFVVQEHQASTHHYDLRLEVDGTMVSWAVPRGPSLDPRVRRLAVQVSDHAIAHNAFEGPTDGGGGVIVWDRGEYEQGGRVPWPRALERGHAVFVLHGEKLRGGFALQRTRATSPAQWLLIKRRDDDAEPGGDITADRPQSAVSGRTLAEVLTTRRA